MFVKAANFMKLVTAERIYMKIYTEFNQRGQEIWKMQVEIHLHFS
jgi:hypothetical protein